jgi:glycosyltransferase involved in cell wall biosynthesis
MATFDPDEELFERQIDSIRAQTNSEWGCLISDDCSDPERFTAIERIVGDDRRFSTSRSSERLGFYRNFERALSMVPAESELVALSDQDDYWYPDKLQALSDSIGGAELAYSDQRLVDRQGRVLRETLWQGRRNNYTSFASILIANTIVGAASMFRRELLSDALPFPEGPGWQFHDHWLAIVAMARGQVRYIDRPLYDYVQHAGAIVSRVGVEDELTSQRISVAERLGALRGLLSRWRPAYFRSYAQLSLQASVVLARCGRRMRRRERRAAVLLTGAEHSPIAFAWLLLRPLRALVGRTETLGSELHLVRGILWRWLIRIRVGRHRVPFGATYEAGLPPFDLAAIGQRRLRRWLAGD